MFESFRYLLHLHHVLLYLGEGDIVLHNGLVHHKLFHLTVSQQEVITAFFNLLNIKYLIYVQMLLT